MNNFIHNYIKRDKWLANGKNYGLFLREVDKLEKLGMSPRKAIRYTKKTIYKLLKNN